MNLFIREAGDLPTYEKAFFRNIVAVFVSGGTLLFGKKGFKIGNGNLKYLFGRAAFGTIGLFCNFYAIDKLDISDASMLNKLSPFFSMIFSIWVLREKPKAKEWLIVAVAFIGALFVVRPSFDVTRFPALIGLIGGAAAGLAYTFVRKLGGRGEPGSNIVFFFSCFSCLVSLPIMVAGYVPMSGRQLLMLLLCGASATGGQYSITMAYQKAPAKEISVFDYTQVIFAAILGYLFLGQIADKYSYIGYVIIIAAAIWKWIENNKKDKGSKNGITGKT